jgi:hypothetical protein
MNKYYREFNKEFSELYIPRFREVYYFFKKHAVNENSLIRKLHLGYTAMREEAFDFVSLEFPWLEDFRIKYNLSKRLNFLETHGIKKPTFEPHIDGKEYNEVMFNVPILNCSKETTTTWVEPIEDFDTVLLCENKSENNTKKGATPHLPDNVKYIEVCNYNITDRAILFRSNKFHKVTNNTKRDEYRIVMHWWYPDYFTWDQAVNLCKDNL